MRSALKGIAWIFMAGSGFLMGGFPTVAQACAVCIGASAEDQGYFWGVLFLMAMPFLVTGSIGGWLLYHHRRTRGATLPPLAGRDVA